MQEVGSWYPSVQITLASKHQDSPLQNKLCPRSKFGISKFIPRRLFTGCMLNLRKINYSSIDKNSYAMYSFIEYVGIYSSFISEKYLINSSIICELL